MSETRPAARYLAEFGVIVLGVLVALLAESAWTERGERVEEREILEWISQDLEADSLALADDRDWVGMVAPAAIQSRAVLEGSDSLSPTGRLAILYATSTIRTPSSLVRTWDDLIASGRISVITDRELRRAVIEFYGRIGEIQAGQAALPTDFRTSTSPACRRSSRAVFLSNAFAPRWEFKPRCGPMWRRR